MAGIDCIARPEAVTVQYYNRVIGKWSGMYCFQITNRKTMRTEVSRLIDRIRLLLLNKLSPVRMETSVRWSNEELVRHTTRITFRGLFCLDSAELFQLHNNGTSLTVNMNQNLAPLFWLQHKLPEGKGEVHHTADGAIYQLPWIGGMITQHTKIVEQGVELIQTSPWFSGRVLLTRK